jgi:flagellin-like protein
LSDTAANTEVPARSSSQDRAISSVVGVALALALTVVLASGAAVAFAFGVTLPASPPDARIAVTVDATANAVVLEHRGGDALHVDDGDLRVVVTVDDTPLRHQPPVPFFAARGFAPGPTGPFNRGYDGAWTAGDTASFELAGTNAPLPVPGDTVTVAIYADGALVARTSTTAGENAASRTTPVQRKKRKRTRDRGRRRPQASASVSLDAAASVSTDSPSGTRASVVMAMSGSYDGPMTRCVTSSNPASWNIRSASASS